MAEKFGAGQLVERVSFSSREIVDDGYGNEVAGDWQERFETRAKFAHLRGGETVMAARLESHSMVLMTVRKSAKTEAVTTDWRVTDVRRDTIFNVREIHEDKSRSLYEMLIESNVGT